MACSARAAPRATTGPDQPDIVFAMRHATLARARQGGAVGRVRHRRRLHVRPSDDRSGAGGAQLHAAADEPCVADGCDEDGGVDNAIAVPVDVFAGRPWLRRLDGRHGSIEVACGRQTLLYTLKNYNGQANDPRGRHLGGCESVGIHEPHDGGVEADGSVCKVDDVAIDGRGRVSREVRRHRRLVGRSRARRSALSPAGSGTSSSCSTAGGDRQRRTPAALRVTRTVTIGTPILVARSRPARREGRAARASTAPGKILSPDGKARAFRLENGCRQRSHERERRAVGRGDDPGRRRRCRVVRALRPALVRTAS